MLAQNAHSSNLAAAPAQEPPHIHRVQPCPYCHAHVYMLEEQDPLTLEKTGRWAAIDYRQTSAGTAIVNITTGTYQVVSRVDRTIYSGWRHALHHTTCTEAARWYRGRM